MKLPQKAKQPTMYFIGVTTGQSSIMKLFPLWTKVFGIENAVIKGIDVELNAKPETYREIVNFIKNDENSLGALVTTHKMNIFSACKDMFDYLDPYATMFEELSSISKSEGKLCGHAKDPITSGLALDSFMPHEFWSNFNGEALVLGAGGSGIAVTSYLINNEEENVPSKIYISNRTNAKLAKAKRIINGLNPNIEFELHQVDDATSNDNLVQNLKPYSLIINATGMGKDIPGSPITDNCIFPTNSIVWEFNYRGELNFMHQALKQKEDRNLTVEDGWTYFLHGWTQVIGEVFHVDVTDKIFNECRVIAETLRK